jgi:hypothetical protein
LDASSEYLSDLYADLRHEYGDKGFFEVEDYTNFLSVFFKNIKIKRSKAVRNKSDHSSSEATRSVAAATLVGQPVANTPIFIPTSIPSMHPHNARQTVHLDSNTTSSSDEDEE